MKKENLEDLDHWITEIRAEAEDDDGQLWVFRRLVRENLKLPIDGWVIGEPVQMVEIDYKGTPRRGLTAIVRRADGSEYTVAAAEVSLSSGFPGARYLDAYRRWLGLDPYPVQSGKAGRARRSHKIEKAGIDPDKAVQMVVLSVKVRTARCRLAGGEREITFRSDRVWDLVPGWMVSVIPHKQWTYAGHPYLSGTTISLRLDVSALSLVPLKLTALGLWDPQERCWGETGEPIEEWAKAIIARGPRPQFIMEQVMPGADPEDEASDPITQANDLMDAGDAQAARRILMDLCQADLRCLDAHAHLGHLLFQSFPEQAIRHYETGVRIGELSLAESLDGLLSWDQIDNRPFLRCLHGYGICLWRLERRDEAERVFNQILWFNPDDNQRVRFPIAEIRAGRPWER